MGSESDDPDGLRNRFARSVIAPELVSTLERAARESRPRRPRSPRKGLVGGEAEAVAGPTVRVIIELSSSYAGGLSQAAQAVLAMFQDLGVAPARVRDATTSRRYVFAELDLEQLKRIGAASREAGQGPIQRIWSDEELKPLLDRSIRTIKADACMNVFGADGRGVVVAVADSGIDGRHPHFMEYGNLDLPHGLEHRDFTDEQAGPLSDGYGHGTLVAGVVAGRTAASTHDLRRIREYRDAGDTLVAVVERPDAEFVIRGVSPRAKLLSLKVLDSEGKGHASSLISALEWIDEINDGGRHLRVHCVNLSLGYPFDPSSYAAGHSPLCKVVGRLSRSGVVVVAAAGNDGSALLQTEMRAGRQRVGVDQSINDPGNAREAITVGSTHAEAPHKYGVSHFSSRGPTADGRVKPDLIAPGEKILSCASSSSSGLVKALSGANSSVEEGVAYLREGTGTSMAAPHVAGCVAALLSLRGEFIGRPEEVKKILMGTCTDLGRKADFQGAGLVDLLRAIQAV